MTARCYRCASTGGAARDRSRARRDRHGRACRGARSGARPKLPTSSKLPQPRGCTLSTGRQSASAAGSLARDARVHDLRGRPYIALRFRGETLPTMLDRSDDPARHRRVCLVVLQDRVPGIPLGFLIGPRELIARIVLRATNTYISPSMVDARSSTSSVCQERSIARSIGCAPRWRTGRDARAGAGRADPGASIRPARGGYFLWVKLPEGLSRRPFLKAPRNASWRSSA